MALPHLIPPKLVDLLAGMELYGHLGSTWLQPRSNLLVDNVEMVEKGDLSYLMCNQVVPEGSSKDMFINRCFPGLPDVLCEDRILISISSVLDFPPNEKLLLWNIKDTFWSPQQTIAAWEIDAETMVLPIREPSMCRIHLLETFAGGYAGWKHACRFLHDHFHVPIQTIGLEIDLDSCKSYAMNHDTLLIDASHMPRDVNFEKLDRDVIIRADIDNDAWLPAICNWGVHIMTISAPCPPWSGA